MLRKILLEFSKKEYWRKNALVKTILFLPTHPLTSTLNNMK